MAAETKDYRTLARMCADYQVSHALLSQIVRDMGLAVAGTASAGGWATAGVSPPPDDPTARPIPGAPERRPVDDNARIKVERADGRLDIRVRGPDQGQWIDLASFVMKENERPYLHPVRDAGGNVVLTEDKPADHPWQHGIFTGFHRVNGFNYWKEDQGRQRFVRLLDLKEASDHVTFDGGAARRLRRVFSG